MADVNNSKAIQTIQKALAINSTEQPKFTVSGSVAGTVEMNPVVVNPIDITFDNLQTTTGTFTIYTTPTDKDFYLCSLVAGWSKDVTCDIATGSINVTVQLANGATKSVMRFAARNLATENSNLAISFPRPILLMRGGVIQMSGTFTAGVLTRCCTGHGFIIENPNA